MEFWILVLGVWLAIEWVRRRRYQTENDERFERLVKTLDRLETENAGLKKLAARVSELEKQVAPPTEPVPGHASQPVVAAEAPHAPAPPAKLSSPPPIATPPPVSLPPTLPVSASKPPEPARIPPTPVVPSVRAPSSPLPQASVEPPHAAPTPPRPATPPPVIPARPVAAPLQESPAAMHAAARRRSTEIEERLGTNWLNKIGITALVIGIALFLAYEFPKLSNLEKVGLGYAVSFVILGAGVYLERLDRYRIFARALIGGGWALTFFTTYAMHFVKYTQVIQTEWVDLVLLFLVAWAMVIHTLRYDSQVVTGLAFLLAFTTVAISQNTVYCLAAGAILAVGLVAIVHRRGWFELEVFGLIASYVNHYIWLRTVIEPMHGHNHMFAEFVPSAVLLCTYWAVYRWSYIARKIQRDEQEHISTLAALLNTAFLLLLLKYQSVHPQWAFYVLLILGAVELTLGQLPVNRRRRTAFVILSTIGTVLMVAAIPFKYSGRDMAILWLAEGQTLFLAGVFTREALFRRFGMAAALLTSLDLVSREAVPILERRLGLSVAAPEDQLAVTFAVAALLFYLNSLWIPRRWRDLIKSPAEETYFRGLAYLAGAMLFASLWLAFQNSWTAVAWSAAALGISVLGRAFDFEDLSHQAHGFALAAFIVALEVNRLDAARWLRTGVTLRLITLSLVIVLFYFCARWAGAAQASATREISEIYTTAAAFLTAVLTYYECHWAWIAPAWTAFALVLAIVGIARSRRDFSYQSHLLAFATFLRALTVNIDATQEYHRFTLRFITFSIVAVLLYACAYFSGPRESSNARMLSALHTTAGSILISVLAYKEVSSPWIAVTWATFALLLLLIGGRWKRMELHLQAYVLSAASMFQVFTVNVYDTHLFTLHPPVTMRLATMALAAALLYACAYFAVRGEFQFSLPAAGIYTWAGSLLIFSLLYYELLPIHVALGWAIFGLALFEVGILWKSLNWRSQAYVAFAFAFAWIFAVNIEAPPDDLLLKTAPLALIFYYAWWRLERETGDFLAQDRRMQAAAVLSYFGSVTLAVVLRFYFHEAWFAPGMAVLAFVLIAVAWILRRDVFLYQSLLLTVAAFVRAVVFNLLEINRPGIVWFDERWFHVALAAALLFAAQAFAFPIRARFANELAKSRGADTPDWALIVKRPEQVYFFASIALVTLLIYNEMSQGRVTMAWGVEALLMFLFALIVGERSFRLAGLGLLLACVGKIVVFDVWRQQKSDRFITFIILGVALLLVSYLYTRYTEAIRRYL